MFKGMRGELSMGLAGLAAILAQAAANEAHAYAYRPRLISFGVDDYAGSSLATCSATDLSEAKLSARGFYNEARENEHITSSRGRYNDLVRDNWLKDSALAGDGEDESFDGFDYVDNALAYFAGHGTCGPDAKQGNKTGYWVCDKKSNPLNFCANQGPPVGGEYDPPTCRDWPDTEEADHRKGTCKWRYRHGPVTCSSNDNPDENTLGYSYEGGPKIKLDKVGAAFFEISCASHLDQVVSNVGAMFSGVHVVGTLWQNTSDATVVEERGETFGYYLKVDGDTPISDLWTGTMFALTSQGHGCSHFTANVPGGMNGCGGAILVAAGTSQNGAAVYRDNMTLPNLVYSNSTVNNPSHFAWKYSCNYDCVNWPPFFE